MEQRPLRGVLFITTVPLCKIAMLYESYSSRSGQEIKKERKDHIGVVGACSAYYCHEKKETKQKAALRTEVSGKVGLGFSKISSAHNSLFFFSILQGL